MLMHVLDEVDKAGLTPNDTVGYKIALSIYDSITISVPSMILTQATAHTSGALLPLLLMCHYYCCCCCCCCCCCYDCCSISNLCVSFSPSYAPFPGLGFWLAGLLACLHGMDIRICTWIWPLFTSRRSIFFVGHLQMVVADFRFSSAVVAVVPQLLQLCVVVLN
jgi:hypothetical protein